MVGRWFIFGVILLVSLLIVSCGVPEEDYEVVVSERDAAQNQLESLQSDLAIMESDLESMDSDLTAASATIISEMRTIKKAKAFAEVLSVFFHPLLTDEAPGPVADVLDQLSEPVQATEDPELERLYNELVDSEGGDQESKNFALYILEELSSILD